MFFIGIITDKHSENNIKNMIKNNDKRKIIFLNKDNVSNFRNVKFDSVVLNDVIDKNFNLNKIIEQSKYILVNYDINYKNEGLKNENANIITYGYNSNATVTISSATEDEYLIFFQKNLFDSSKLDGIQEIKFEKEKDNINAYDGMIVSIMDELYKSK